MHGKTRAVISIFLLLFTVFMVGATCYFHLQYKKDQEIKSAEIATQKAKDDAITAARQEFDKLLNAMIDELAVHAKDYRKQRIVLKETIHPLNFEKPELAQESYDVFTKDIAPLLRKSADTTIEIFQTYDKKAKAMLATMPETLKAELQIDWDALQKKQLEDYVAFFTKEDELIRAHQTLIKFYVTHVGTYTLDEAGEHLVFDNETDAQQEQKLRDTIADLKKTDQ